MEGEGIERRNEKRRKGMQRGKRERKREGEERRRRSERVFLIAYLKLMSLFLFPSDGHDSGSTTAGAAETQ